MTDYNEILETETAPGAPGKSSLWKRWSKNVIAMFEGALNAPRLLGEAIARGGYGLPVLTITSTDAFDISEGTLQVYGPAAMIGTTAVSALKVTIQTYTGAMRFRVSHASGGGGWSANLALYKNGSLVISLATTSMVAVARVVDVVIAPGDIIEWLHSSSGSSGISNTSAFGIRGSNCYIPQTAFRRAV